MHRFYIVIFLSLILVSASEAQFREDPPSQGMSIKPGIGFEAFSRTITWDDGETESKLKSNIFTLNAKFDMEYGFSFSLFLGYAFSSYNAMIFRELPVSVELDIGRIQGFIFGGEIKKDLLSIESLDVGAQAQFAYYLGKREEWDIPGLAVEGTVSGKPRWMRVTIGPLLTYRGLNSIHPYIYLAYNKFWGTFKMDQTIEDLKGNEEKKIKGKDEFSFSLGAIYELIKALQIRVEANFMSNLDLGATIRIMYTF